MRQLVTLDCWIVKMYPVSASHSALECWPDFSKFVAKGYSSLLSPVIPSPLLSPLLCYPLSPVEICPHSQHTSIIVSKTHTLTSRQPYIPHPRLNHPERYTDKRRNDKRRKRQTSENLNLRTTNVGKFKPQNDKRRNNLNLRTTNVRKSHNFIFI